MLRLTCLTVAALLPYAGALKEYVLEERLSEDSEDSKPHYYYMMKKKKPHKQRLENAEDVQYYVEFLLGGQPMKGLLDTGSFELLAFSKSCMGCLAAAKFDSAASSTFVSGTLSQIHSYGSGSCTATDAFDKISMGTMKASKQAFWLTTSCNMPVLQSAAFNAVMGIGPPGEPVAYAEHRIKELQQMEDGYKSSGMHIPWSVKQEKQNMEGELAIASKKKDLLESLRVRTFSMCLGKSPGSAGFVIWHDRTRSDTLGVLTIPVAGNQSWSVKLEDMSFGRHKTDIFGCRTHCAGLVDTGTSLFGFPSEIYDKMISVISKTEADCSDLRTFPDLRMKLGGEKLRFPPSSYVGSFHGSMSAEVQHYIRPNLRLRSANGTHCQLLIMDLGPAQMTSLGPVVVLGMPFFREYYTTFHMSHHRWGPREIYVSKSDDKCGPSTGENVMERSKRSDSAYQPRTVDASKLRLPHWVKRLRDI